MFDSTSSGYILGGAIRFLAQRDGSSVASSQQSSWGWRMSASSVVPFHDGKSSTVAFHDSKNDSTRIDLFEELDNHATVALRAFFRRMGAPHIFEERIVPTLNDGESHIFAAVRDRPWPPWGLGARHISAVCQAHSVDDNSFAISPVYVTDEDLTNIALMSAVYKEVLDYLVRAPGAEVNYLVIEGSTFADYVLVSNGFKKTKDIYLTESARYFTYRIEAEELLHRLGLDAVSTFDILSGRVNGAVFERNALFQSMMYLASRPAWGTTVAEIIPLQGGHLYMDPPGGAPEPSPEPRPRPEIGPGKATFVVVENFLSTKERQALMDFVLAQEINFVHSAIKQSPLANGVDERKRRSKVLAALERFDSFFDERIRATLPSVLKRLEHAAFEIERIEIQATASGDGDFYQLHLDEYGGGVRELSFVYFFHREPQRFSGGELRICDAMPIDGNVNGGPKANNASHILVPRQNTMVFFLSRSLHEILPVRVPSRSFADSRFTVNGWICRK